MNSIQVLSGTNLTVGSLLKSRQIAYRSQGNDINQNTQVLPQQNKEPGFLDYIFQKLDTVGIIFIVDIIYQLINIVLTTQRKSSDFGFWVGSVAGLFRNVFVRWLTVFASLKLASQASFGLSHFFSNPADAKPKVESLLSFLFGAFVDLVIGNKVMLFLFDRMLKPNFKTRLLPIAKLCGYKGN